jgi:hypothetical protein
MIQVVFTQNLQRHLPCPPVGVTGSTVVEAQGSTTGSLWISGNGGDGWECVSSHLPPIYALRFAQ